MNTEAASTAAGASQDAGKPALALSTEALWARLGEGLAREVGRQAVRIAIGADALRLIAEYDGEKGFGEELRRRYPHRRPRTVCAYCRQALMYAAVLSKKELSREDLLCDPVALETMAAELEGVEKELRARTIETQSDLAAAAAPYLPPPRERSPSPERTPVEKRLLAQIKVLIVRFRQLPHKN